VKPVERREGAEVVVHGWEGNDFNWAIAEPNKNNSSSPKCCYAMYLCVFELFFKGFKSLNF